MATTRTRSLHQYASEYFPGRNLMTADLISQNFVGRFAVELSRGELMNKPIYGVSVRDRYTGERSDELSKAVYALSEAEAHIGTLADL